MFDGREPVQAPEGTDWRVEVLVEGLVLARFQLGSTLRVLLVGVLTGWFLLISRVPGLVVAGLLRTRSWRLLTPVFLLEKDRSGWRLA